MNTWHRPPNSLAKFVSAGSSSAKEILVRTPKGVIFDRTIAEVGIVEAAHDRKRRRFGLAQDEIRGTGDLVGDRDFGDFEYASRRVSRTAQVQDWLHTGRTDRDISDPDAPRTSEGVGDDHRDLDISTAL